MSQRHVLLLDVGASYANYNADLTRTLPVGGRFSRRQSRCIRRAACSARGIQVATRASSTRLAERKRATHAGGTAQLGLLKPADVRNRTLFVPRSNATSCTALATRLGWMSRCRHYHGAIPGRLGPDRGTRDLYPRRGLGLRLGEQHSSGRKGNTDLMADIPIEADEIEELMAAGKKR